MKGIDFKLLATVGIAAMCSAMASAALAADQAAPAARAPADTTAATAATSTDEMIIVSGIRAGLKSSLDLRARFKSLSSIAVLCGTSHDHADGRDLCPCG
jgi:hypothetical protein